jgi:hypothetical protein
MTARPPILSAVVKAFCIQSGDAPLLRQSILTAQLQQGKYHFNLR